MLTDLDLANLCAATYFDPAQFDTVFSGSEDKDVWVGLKNYPDCCAVAFRGSTTIEDWIRDFEGIMINDPELGFVEKGFMAGIRDAYAQLSPHIKFPLYVTGHSLGAARALLFTALCTVKVARPRPVVFGCPRPGGAKLKSVLSATKGRSYKNLQDPVTDVPFDIPFIAEYRQPYDLLTVEVAPPANDPWGPLADHHIELYQQAMEKIYGKPSAGE